MAFKRMKRFEEAKSPLATVNWNVASSGVGPGSGASGADHEAGLRSVNNKRKRGERGVFPQAACEMTRLRLELAEVKAEAIAKVSNAELVNQNLKQACEEQQRQLQRIQQENRLLKKSVMVLHSKRDESDRELRSAQEMVVRSKHRIEELERVNAMLCLQNHSMNSCRKDRWSDHTGGNGPVF
eukprot:CAMPEP_0184528148 /NCGR_PEP_ID=MMETSP0198_2-20121128/11631_1 /TAXON_ID=1112570 /ORGANISM="Thraustochytrium sp., Strain LLF1b" /LENGTH=182 /DNA_ID=CAMNT_0026919963 /DNA_START=381 /DNA_END=929 /DNA_ORIENTATION=+